MNKTIAEFIPDNPQPIYTNAYANTSNSSEFIQIVLILAVFVLLIWLVIKFALPKASHYLGYLVREFEKGKKL